MRANAKRRTGTTACTLLLLATACQKPQPPALRTNRPLPVYVSELAEDCSWQDPFATIDVDTDHAVRYHDVVIFDPAVDDPIVLTRALTALRRGALDAGDILLEQRNIDGEWKDVVERPLRVLGHKWSLWSTHKQVMAAASQPEIGIWMVQLALFVPDE